MAEQRRILAVLDLRGLPPGQPWSKALGILQESLESTTFGSGDFTFTVAVEGFGDHAEVRDV